jgi:hypothetical protein
MYRLGLVDTLVIHANTNRVWPNFLVWSPPWLYASSVNNKKKQRTKVAAQTWCGHVPTSICPQARLLDICYLPKLTS